MLSILYSLASEGGSMLYFTEGFMTGEKAWAQYVENVGHLRLLSPAPRVAVILPRTSLTGESSFAFDRVAGQLRDYFGFDVVDERDLPSISARITPYFCIVGKSVVGRKPYLHSRDGFVPVRRWLCMQKSPGKHRRAMCLVTNGYLPFNWCKLRTVGNLNLASKHPTFESSNPIAQQERRVVKMGIPGDDVFLEGLWGQSESEMQPGSMDFLSIHFAGWENGVA
jgi:hypothetical protein